MRIRPEEIREYVNCPQFGDLEYGKWGALRLDQRTIIKGLCEWAIYLEKLVDEYNIEDNKIKRESRKYAKNIKVLLKELKKVWLKYIISKYLMLKAYNYVYLEDSLSSSSSLLIGDNWTMHFIVVVVVVVEIFCSSPSEMSLEDDPLHL